jgi:hypothetical protein
MNEEKVPNIVLNINVKLNAEEGDWGQNGQHIRKYVTQKEEIEDEWVWVNMAREAWLSNDPHKVEAF